VDGGFASATPIPATLQIVAGGLGFVGYLTSGVLTIFGETAARRSFCLYLADYVSVHEFVHGPFLPFAATQRYV
jgi:hypothetical protein